MRMACRVIKKILGYVICVLDKEGTLFYSDPIVIIRKEGFTEIYNIEKLRHETGDIIVREETRNTIYEFINDNLNLFV